MTVGIKDAIHVCLTKVYVLFVMQKTLLLMAMGPHFNPKRIFTVLTKALSKDIIQRVEPRTIEKMFPKHDLV